jgi:hypothetical protein
MNNFIDNNGAAGRPPAAEQPQVEISDKGAARRRFARAGAGAVGVIATLASQPGMASVVCASPSGMGSKTHSSHAPASESACGGRSPGYWKHPTLHPWPSPYSPTMKFREVFTISNFCSTIADTTLCDILIPKKTPHNVGQNLVAYYMVATLLNAAAKNIGFLKPQQVLGMWTEYMLNLTYLPTAGAKLWGRPEMISYLRSIMESDSSTVDF